MITYLPRPFDHYREIWDLGLDVLTSLNASRPWSQISVKWLVYIKVSKTNCNLSENERTVKIKIKTTRYVERYSFLYTNLGRFPFRKKNPGISVEAKVEFPIGKKLFHLVVSPGTSRCPFVFLQTFPYDLPKRWLSSWHHDLSSPVC